MKRVLLCCVALLTIVSCSKYDSPTAPAPGRGQLTVTVVDAATKAGIANVTIEVRQTSGGPVLYTAVTNASGVAGLTVPAGSYWVSAVAPPGYSSGAVTTDARMQLTVVAGESVAVTISIPKT
jgi:hypothetical protein